MDVAIGQAKFDATVLKLLALQTETARAGLLDLMAEEEIKIYAAPGRARRKLDRRGWRCRVREGASLAYRSTARTALGTG